MLLDILSFSYYNREINARPMSCFEFMGRIIFGVSSVIFRRGPFCFIPAVQAAGYAIHRINPPLPKAGGFLQPKYALTTTAHGTAWMPRQRRGNKARPNRDDSSFILDILQGKLDHQGRIPLLKVDKSGRGSSAARPNRDDSGFIMDTPPKAGPDRKGTGTMRQIELSQNGQNLIEYAIVVAVVVSAMLAMSTYVFRSVQATQQTIQTEFADQ